MDLQLQATGLRSIEYHHANPYVNASLEAWPVATSGSLLPRGNEHDNFPLQAISMFSSSPLLARKRWTPVQEPGVRAILALLIGNAGAVRDPTCTFLSIATRDHNPPSSPFWLRRKRSVHQLPFQRRCDSLGITSITRNPKTARNRRVA